MHVREKPIRFAWSAEPQDAANLRSTLAMPDTELSTRSAGILSLRDTDDDGPTAGSFVSNVVSTLRSRAIRKTAPNLRENFVVHQF